MTESSEIPFGLEVTKGVVAKFLMAILGFIGTILFARILGPVSFGGFYLVMAVVSIAKLPVDGFASAGMKRFSESNAIRSEVLSTTTVVIVLITFIGAIGAIVFQSRLEAYTEIPSSHLLFIILFATSALFTPLQKMLSGTGQISRTIWIDFIRSVLTTPLQLIFVLLNLGAAGMAYGLSLATSLTVPLTYYALNTRLSVPEWQTITDLWSFARFSTPATTLNRVYGRLDVLVLGALLSPAAVGNYEVALKLTIPAVLISEVAGEGLMARVSNLASKGESVSMDISNTLSFSSILAVPLFFGASVLSEPLVVTLYGPQYSAAVPLLIGLALYRIFQTQSNPLIQTIKGLDRPDITVWIAAGTLTLNVPLGIGLTLQIGAAGVVIATVIAEGVKYLAAAAWIRHTNPKVNIVSRTLAEQFFSGAVMAGVVGVLNLWVPVRSWIHLVALVGIGAIIYACCLLILSSRLRYTIVSTVGDADIS
jgi:O-antigen/teichoic acid export membrane protein